MADLQRALKKPKLLFEVSGTRRRVWRRFRLALILLLVGAGALAALTVVQERGLVDSNTLDIGRLAAIAIIALMFIRTVIGLVQLLRLRNETMRFFNRGFTWERGGEKYQYSWSKLRSVREGGRGLNLGKRSLLQWGALTLTMSDQHVFKLTPAHGDLRQFAKAIRPYAAEATGIRMGRQLREEKPVQLHKKLILWPGGLQVGKEELPWETLNVSVKGDKLVIRAKRNGKVRVVRRFNTGSIDNLGGFMELATTTIRTHRA